MKLKGVSVLPFPHFNPPSYGTGSQQQGKHTHTTGGEDNAEEGTVRVQILRVVVPPPPLSGCMEYKETVGLRRKPLLLLLLLEHSLPQIL